MTSTSSQERQQSPLLVCLELSAVGLITTLLQVLAIMSLRSLDNIFTSSSQLLLLLPIAFCILFVVLAAAFAELQARRYITKLDTRLNIVYDLITPVDAAYPKNYLSNIFFPLIFYLPATPFVGLFLILYTPYLLLVLLVSILAQSIVISYYNRKIRYKSLSARYQQIKSLSNKPQQDLVEVPGFFLRDQLYSRHNHADDTADVADDLDDPDLKLVRRKRDALGIVRASYQATILATSAVLALLQLSSLSDILGFFIISTSLRRGSLAAIEFIYPRTLPIKLSQAYRYFCDSLLSSQQLFDLITDRYETLDASRQKFNERYSAICHNKSVIRFKKFSLIHTSDGVVIDQITQRISLAPVIFVAISNHKLYQQVRQLICTPKSDNIWQTSGSIILSGEPFPTTLLANLPIRSPLFVRPLSSELSDYFSPSLESLCRSLTLQYQLYSLISESSSSLPPVSEMNRRQLIRLRSVVACLTVLLEPAYLSVLAFALDCFDESERAILVRMLAENPKSPISSTVCIQRKDISSLPSVSSYQLTRTSLDLVS